MAEVKIPDFFIIPSVLVADKNIKPKDCLVYGAVYWFTKLRNERCIASNKTIASVIGCSLSTVTHALVRLNKAGYIQVRIDEHNHREEIIPLVAFSHIDTPGNSEQPLGKIEQGGLANLDRAPGKIGQQNKNIEKEDSNKIGHPLTHVEPFGSSRKNGARISAYSKTEKIPNTEWQAFFAHFKEKSGQTRTVDTADRRAKYRTRRKTFSSEEMMEAVDNCYKDAFYSGKNNRNWTANIDYILRNDEVLDRLLQLKPRQNGGIIEVT